MLQDGSSKPHFLKAFWCLQPIECSGSRIQPGVSQPPLDAQSWPRAGSGHKARCITAGTAKRPRRWLAPECLILLLHTLRAPPRVPVGFWPQIETPGVAWLCCEGNATSAFCGQCAWRADRGPCRGGEGSSVC